jgi:hypothetical protein
MSARWARRWLAGLGLPLDEAHDRLARGLHSNARALLIREQAQTLVPFWAGQSVLGSALAAILRRKTLR